MGTFIFFLHYVIAFILLFTILCRSYEINNYKQTDIRHKYPLWFILSAIMVYFIPIGNLIAYILWICFCVSEDFVYFKSFLTKRY